MRNKFAYLLFILIMASIWGYVVKGYHSLIYSVGTILLALSVLGGILKRKKYKDKWIIIFIRAVIKPASVKLPERE